MQNKDFTVITTVDTNDGDYLTTVRHISHEKLIQLRRCVKLIKKEYGRPGIRHIRFNTGDDGEKMIEKGIWSDEDCQEFNEYTGYPEYGYHTLISIEVSPYAKAEQLLISN